MFRLDTPYARERIGGRAAIGGPVFDADEVAAEALSEPARPNGNDHPQVAPDLKPNEATVP
jgi:hypothetical protein